MVRLRRVVGSSMAPTLRHGAIIAFVPATRFHKGEVVVVRHGGLEKIKRIGDISQNLVFLTGDNPEFSTDSREFGWIDVQTIRGKVIWPRNL